jgi:hypothetical protein
VLIIEIGPGLHTRLCHLGLSGPKTANAKSFEIIIVDDEVCRHDIGKLSDQISFLM